MTNTFLSNKSLEKLVEETPLISDDQKKELINRLPYSDREERIDMLIMLKDIILLDIERKKVVEKAKQEKSKIAND